MRHTDRKSSLNWGGAEISHSQVLLNTAAVFCLFLKQLTFCLRSSSSSPSSSPPSPVFSSSLRLFLFGLFSNCCSAPPSSPRSALFALLSLLSARFLLLQPHLYIYVQTLVSSLLRLLLLAPLTLSPPVSVCVCVFSDRGGHTWTWSKARRDASPATSPPL